MFSYFADMLRMADNAQKADMLALEFAFLWQALGEEAGLT